MSFTPFTFEQHRKFITDTLRQKLPRADISPGSFWNIWVQAQARGLAGLTSALTHGKRQILPDNAVGLDLDHHGAVYNQPRLIPTRARGTVICIATGSISQTDGSEIYLEDSAHRKYRILDDLEVTFAGTFVLRVEAEFTGSAGNLAQDTTLTFGENRPAELEEKARVLPPGFHGGWDLEADGDLQTRLMDTLSGRSLGDTREDYEKWTIYDGLRARPEPRVFTVGTEVLRIKEVFVYRDEEAQGRVYVLPLTDSAQRIGPDGFCQAVYDAVESQLPVTVDLVVPRIRSKRIGIKLYVEPKIGARWDWYGLKTVDRHNGSDRTIKLRCKESSPDYSDPFAGMDGVVGLLPGMRVLIQGEQRVIGHVDKTANTITLTEDLTHVPQSAAKSDDGYGLWTRVYPGGPIIEDVQQAVTGLFDVVGPLHKVIAPAGKTHSVLHSIITDAVMEVPEVFDTFVEHTDLLDADPLINPAYCTGMLAYLAAAGDITIAPMAAKERD